MKSKKFIIGSTIIVLLVILIFVYGRETVGAGGTSLPNPLSTGDPRVLAGYIIKAILGVTGSVALAIFIIGGFMWMLSSGSQKRVKKGTSMMVWAALGLAIIFFAYSIVNFLFTAMFG